MLNGCYCAFLYISYIVKERGDRVKIKEELKRLKPLNFLCLTVAGIINALGVTIFLYQANQQN